MTEQTEIRTTQTTENRRAWIGYVVPTALYIAFTTLEGILPAYYVPIYIAKAAVLSAALIIYRSTLHDFRFNGRALISGLLVGLLIYALWIPVDKITPIHLPLGNRSAFNPFAHISNPAMRRIFLLVRFYGLVALIPIMEELFWRSFLLRFFSNPDGDFKAIPIGQFTWGAFWLVVAAFALAHPEWLSAAICGTAYGLLLWRTRNLSACLVAHAVTNLLLGLYIVHFHAWAYW